MSEFRLLGQVIAGDLDDWVCALPAYQRRLIKSMLESATPTEVATLWLADAGPKDTAPYGGVRAGASRFYGNILFELQKLLCLGVGYEDEKQEVKHAASTSKMVLVGVVSTSIAPHVGAAAAVIGPAVALTLAVLSNAGRASACETLAQMIRERESD
jgi:hypothetical protein